MKKILLIEDEEQHAALVKLRLERKGYEVVTAGTGREGIEAAAGRPDLILTDLLLPDMPPEELLDGLKAAGDGRRPPVIAFTALDEFELERRKLGKRFSGVVRKPYETSELIDAVEKALRAGTRGGGA